jgi:hypothetical protein
VVGEGREVDDAARSAIREDVLKLVMPRLASSAIAADGQSSGRPAVLASTARGCALLSQFCGNLAPHEIFAVWLLFGEHTRLLIDNEEHRAVAALNEQRGFRPTKESFCRQVRDALPPRSKSPSSDARQIACSIEKKIATVHIWTPTPPESCYT